MRIIPLILIACSPAMPMPVTDAALMTCTNGPVDLVFEPCRGGALIVELGRLAGTFQFGTGLCIADDCTLVSWGSVVEHWTMAEEFHRIVFEGAIAK